MKNIIKNFSLWKSAKEYYENKNIYVRIGFFILILVIVIILLLPVKKETSPSYVAIHNTLHFAGEQIPVYGPYVTNIEKFDRELAILTAQPHQILMVYKRRNRYMPYIQKELQKAGIPTDMQYIPIIESFLRIHAISPAGSAGIWQLMPETAQRYGLRVDNLIDERFDFYKSTQVAIRYLKNLYKIFGNRILVAAAYNRGENGLKRDLGRQYVDNYHDAFLNAETSRYIYRLLAIKHIFENLDTYLPPQSRGNRYPKYITRTISIDKIDDIALRAKQHGYTYLQIRELNPRIRGRSLPEGEWKLQVRK